MTDIFQPNMFYQDLGEDELMDEIGRFQEFHYNIQDGAAADEMLKYLDKLINVRKRQVVKWAKQDKLGVKVLSGK